MRNPHKISFFKVTYPGQILSIVPLLIGAPLLMVLFGDFNGDTVSLAFGHIHDMLVTPQSAFTIWAILAVMSILLVWYLHPVILISATGFILGESGSQFLNDPQAFITGARDFLSVNEFSKGLHVGMIVSFNPENILFDAKKKALTLFPDSEGKGQHENVFCPLK